MKNSPPAGSADRRPRLLARVFQKLTILAMSRLLRFAGWGAVVGLPAMVFGSQRMGRIVKRYPIVSASLTLLLAAGAAVWSNGEPVRAPEYEIESIEHFDETPILLAENGPRLLDLSGLPVENGANIASRSSNYVGGKPTISKNPDLSPALGTPASTNAEADSQRRSLIVWLTGEIEEISPDASVSPVRSADRISSNRQ